MLVKDAKGDYLLYAYRKGDRPLQSESKAEPRATLTLVEAARRLGIGRNQAYEAAHRGEIPLIKIGKRLLVPRAALDRMLSGEAA